MCSVRTLYRILEKEDATHQRRNPLRHLAYTKPELLATAANHVWSRDITNLRGRGAKEPSHSQKVPEPAALS